MHIPDDPGFYEKFYFTPGDIGFEPIQTSVGKLGVLVCWDQWFPEAVTALAMKVTLVRKAMVFRFGAIRLLQAHKVNY